MTGMAAASVVAPLAEPISRNDEIDEFIYLISHDLRASIRALIELPHWIEDDLKSEGVKIGDSVRGSIEMMNQHTGRLDQMLIDLLAYSRIGRMQTVETLDMSRLLDVALEQVQPSKAVKIVRQINQPLIVMGDTDAQLMLTALISNAIKHHTGDASQITLRTSREGDMFRLTVSDNGPGIPARLHARAMAPMTTLRPRDEVEGTGMGLASVAKIAAHYGGHMALSKADEARGGLQVDVVVPR